MAGETPNDPRPLVGRREHTPGPWGADPNHLINGDEIVVASDQYPDLIVAAVWPWGDDEVGTAEREANARLIAAAPDLLAALQGLVDAAHGSDDEGIPETVAVARAAIAKATAVPSAAGGRDETIIDPIYQPGTDPSQFPKPKGTAGGVTGAVGGKVCSHGAGVLVAHVSDGLPCSDYLLAAEQPRTVERYGTPREVAHRLAELMGAAAPEGSPAPEPSDRMKPPRYMEPRPERTLVAEILDELTRARHKYPADGNCTMLALGEEYGEVCRAVGEESRERVRAEAVQVAAMAMRIVLDGDPTLDGWRADRGLDPLVDDG